MAATSAPTLSEANTMAASLKHMTGMATSSKNSPTISKAAKFLEQQAQLIAERVPSKKQLEEQDRDRTQLEQLKKRIAEISAASVEDSDITLVARDGATITMKASLAGSASPYFEKVLDSKMREAASKRIEYPDVDISTLRFFVSGMHAGETGADLLETVPQDVEAIVQIINFSDRLQMPWLGQAALRSALESAADNAVLLARLAPLLPEAQAGLLIVCTLDILRSKPAEGVKELRTALVEYMASMFRQLVGRAQDELVLMSMSCTDLEALIARPDLDTGLDHDEMSVLKAVLGWVLGSKHASDGDIKRLLRHVRLPYIKLQKIKEELSKEELALANASEDFDRGFKEAVGVQKRNRKATELAGVRAEKRAKAGPHVSIPRLDVDQELQKAFLQP